MSEYTEFICIERQNAQDTVLDHADNVRQGLDLPSQITSRRRGVEGIKLEGQLWIRRIAADMASYRTLVLLTWGLLSFLFNDNGPSLVAPNSDKKTTPPC
jgi:hypothetical protein